MMLLFLFFSIWGLFFHLFARMLNSSPFPRISRRFATPAARFSFWPGGGVVMVVESTRHHTQTGLVWSCFCSWMGKGGKGGELAGGRLNARPLTHPTTSPSCSRFFFCILLLCERFFSLSRGVFCTSK
ncbi:hypothetical protein IWZ01DRAFT_108629 [Phyllosticta capitalensis]